MPSTAKRFCSAPGCSAIVSGGRCPAHSRERERGGSTERGYNAAWQRFRAVYLKSHPLCCDCLEADRVTVATDIHHVLKLAQRPELKYEASNLRALCKACHDARTARGE